MVTTALHKVTLSKQPQPFILQGKKEGTREEQIYDAGGKMKKNKNKTPTKYRSPLIFSQHQLLPLA
jgi:hypothetical protein